MFNSQDSTLHLGRFLSLQKGSLNNLPIRGTSSLILNHLRFGSQRKKIPRFCFNSGEGRTEDQRGRTEEVEEWAEEGI